MNIFISHKHEDVETALLLKRRLEAFGGGSVDCFVSEHVEYGADWFERIRDNLNTADVLVLIFTSADMTWDWPLYEVGLATDLSDPERCCIITLYPPGAEPPAPIRHVQAVEATVEGIKRLVLDLFCTCEIIGADEPVNPRLQGDPESVERFAEELSARFSSAEPWENTFTYSLLVTLPNGAVVEEVVPEGARIEPESSALALFGLAPTPPGESCWTWGSFLETIGRSNGDHAQWVDDLGERFYWAGRGENLRDFRATFRAPATGELYRPLVHRATLRRDASMAFEVICVRHFEGEG